MVTFMGILKKMMQDYNLEGLAYLVPILMNVKHLLPKVWNYAVSRRPEIDRKMNEYAEFLIRKEFTREKLHDKSAIIWGETIFDMTEKMTKLVNSHPPHTINLEDHKEFFDGFISHFVSFRHKVQQDYEQEIEKYNRDREIGSSFNMYLLDSYVPKLYRGYSVEEEWQKLKAKAEEVNKKLHVSLSTDLVDFIFVGSTSKYQKIDI